MRGVKKGLILVLMLLFAVSAQAETKNKKFTKEEIKRCPRQRL